MSNITDKWWSRLAPKLQRALGFAPLTPAEAEAEMATVDEVPLSEEEIERIVNTVRRRTKLIRSYRGYGGFLD